MSKIFWGFFFVFIHFNLTFNDHTASILPPFIGCILLVQGMRAMEGESETFQYPRPFAAGLAVYTGIVWVGELLGVTSGGWLGLILELISSLAELYIAWAVIQAVRDVEMRRAAELNGEAMQRSWYALAVVTLLSFSGSLLFRFYLVYMGYSSLKVFSLAASHAWLIAAFALVWLVVIIKFLAAVWRSKRLYEGLPPLEPSGPECF